jgi:hypothetical protein
VRCRRWNVLASVHPVSLVCPVLEGVAGERFGWDTLLGGGAGGGTAESGPPVESCTAELFWEGGGISRMVTAFCSRLAQTTDLVPYQSMLNVRTSGQSGFLQTLFFPF